MLKVIDIMSRKPITVPQGMSLRRAMARLVTEHISGAPVEDSGRLVGVITCSDLLMFAAAPLRRCESNQPRRGAKGLEQPSGALRRSELADEGAHLTVAEDVEADLMKGLADSFDLQPSALDEYSVRDAMTTTIHTIEPDADAAEAAELMVSVGAHRLVVVQKDSLVGIVSTTDITKAVADGRLRDLTIVSGHGVGCDTVRYPGPNLLLA